MKRVLVVGKGSYIGSSFARYAKSRFDIVAVGSRDGEWREVNFSGFDGVICAAGIAHRKQTKANKDLYFAVNRDLAVEVAGKAKAAGVGQFVYLSSMAVYGVKKGEIGKETIPMPCENDWYGLSKYQAEKLLVSMQTDQFKVACIRPPMVYGPGCEGKFQSLLKIAKLTPFLPTIRNQRSMIYIDNLTEFLSIVIEQGLGGVFCPQNREYVCTAELLESVRVVLGKRVWRMPLMNIPIRMLMPASSALGSAFGSLVYHKSASEMPFDRGYQAAEFEESVKRSVDSGYEA